MTVEEGSILDCKDSAPINKCRSNADAPQALCTLLAMAQLGYQTSGRLAAIYRSRFGKLIGVAGQGHCWCNISAIFIHFSAVRPAMYATIKVEQFEPISVEIGSEMPIL